MVPKLMTREKLENIGMHPKWLQYSCLTLDRVLGTYFKVRISACKGPQIGFCGVLRHILSARDESPVQNPF